MRKRVWTRNTWRIWPNLALLQTCVNEWRLSERRWEMGRPVRSSPTIPVYNSTWLSTHDKHPDIKLWRCKKGRVCDRLELVSNSPKISKCHDFVIATCRQPWIVRLICSIAGSSCGHLDETIFDDELMTPFVNDVRVCHVKKELSPKLWSLHYCSAISGIILGTAAVGTGEMIRPNLGTQQVHFSRVSSAVDSKHFVRDTVTMLSSGRYALSG